MEKSYPSCLCLNNSSCLTFPSSLCLSVSPRTSCTLQQEERNLTTKKETQGHWQMGHLCRVWEHAAIVLKTFYRLSYKSGFLSEKLHNKSNNSHVVGYSWFLGHQVVAILTNSFHTCMLSPWCLKPLFGPWVLYSLSVPTKAGLWQVAVSLQHWGLNPGPWGHGR